MALKHRIDELYTAHPFYGSRKLTVVLAGEFGPINRKRVQRYIREMGIQGIAPGPNLSKRQTEHLIYPYLLRNLTAQRPNHVWGCNITYIRLRYGWLYLVAVLDWYSRYVVSWTLDESLELGFVLDAIAQARLVATPEMRELAKLCVALRWRYMIRLANTTLITFADGRQVALDQLGITPGQRRYFTNVRLTQEADWRCHLAITWTKPKPGEPAELCAIMTNWVPSKWVLNHYLRRMHVEQSFRGEKSGSFDLHHSHLRNPQRLDHLLLAIAVAVLWRIYELGEQVLREDKRADIDPAYERQLSVFQLGWPALRRALSCFGASACTLRLRPFRLAPVYRGATRSSRKASCCSRKP